MNIAVIGSGYVGLVTGTCFADTGNQVICVDNNEEKVKTLKNGKVTIFEPDLDVIFERNVKQQRLTFTTNLSEAVAKSQLIFLALPTPPNEDGSADITHVLNVAKDIGKLLTDYKVIINKSTVPVGTAEKVKEAIAKNYKGEFDVVSNPEFLREGLAVEDFNRPDRVVVGTRSECAKKLIERLYEPFVRQGNPILFMDERSAELTKYAANSYLAMRISFMNEIANLSEKLGANVDEVRRGISSDSRIGKRFLFPGLGYGGSCFPKDVLALSKMGEPYKYSFKILNAVLEVNAFQRKAFLDKVYTYFGNDLKGKSIALWGLAFKPNTDDMREAPSVYIIEDLLKKGCTISAFDPEAMDNAKKIFGNKIKFAENEYDVLRDADALLIITEWGIFRTPDFEKMSQLMRHKTIFDGRNLYNLQLMQTTGFYYNSIGRETIEEKIV
jgi:UDPglucose 6-dehydrogenase